MCLATINTEEQLQEWLKGQPEYIKAYKIVQLSYGCGQKRLWPPFQSIESPPNYYKRRNLLRIPTHNNKSEMIEYPVRNEEKTYTAYYHLLLNYKDASTWDAWRAVTKCYRIYKTKIPKKFITAKGTQSRRDIVVTRCFMFNDKRAEKYL